MTAIILAGGKSSRMGYDKAFIKIDGLAIIERQLRLLRRIFKEIIIVTNSPRKYNIRAVKVVKDTLPERGPLAGIYSGLAASDSFYNFIVACDMPFIDSRLIKYMAAKKRGFDAVVPKIKKGYETLFAIYSKNCVSPIRESLNTGNFRVTEFFDKVRLREVGEIEVKQFGNPRTLFMNINTPKDLCRISTRPRN